MPGPLEGTGDAKENGPTSKELQFRGRAEKQSLTHGHRGWSMEGGFGVPRSMEVTFWEGRKRGARVSRRGNVTEGKEAASESQSF